MASFINTDITDSNGQHTRDNLLEIYGSYMLLQIFVDSDDDDLNNKYIAAINNHNRRITENIHHIDAGFDLYCPSNLEFSSTKVNKLDFNVTCAASVYKEMRDNTIIYNTGYYMYPRSSISKSQLRLANNTGIIDAGYRGHLIGMFDVVYNQQGSTTSVEVNKFDRYLQICAPNLMPIYAVLVNSSEELGCDTARGAGGFGSTGL